MCLFQEPALQAFPGRKVSGLLMRTTASPHTPNKNGRAQCPARYLQQKFLPVGHLIFFPVTQRPLASLPTVIPECCCFRNRATAVPEPPHLPWQRSGSPGGWVCSLYSGISFLWAKEKPAMSALAPGQLRGLLALLPARLNALYIFYFSLLGMILLLLVPMTSKHLSLLQEVFLEYLD